MSKQFIDFGLHMTRQPQRGHGISVDVCGRGKICRIGF